MGLSLRVLLSLTIKSFKSVTWSIRLFVNRVFSQLDWASLDRKPVKLKLRLIGSAIRGDTNWR